MWMPIDRRFPWIEVASSQAGAFVRDTRTGEQAPWRTEHDLHRFIAAHSSAQGHGGLGDLLRGLTKKLGFGECTPCAKRQAALNGMAPRVFRRR